MHQELKKLLFSSSLFILAGGLFGPIYAVFVQNIGGDLLTAGTAYAIFSIVAGVLMFVISKWEDHVKHQEKLVVIGYGLACLGFLGYLFVKKPIDLFMVQIIFGISTAISSPAYDGLYSQHLDKGKFASQWGLWEGMDWVVTGIAALLGGFLASMYGFHSLFMLMFIISLVGLVCSFSLLKKKRKKSHNK